MKKLKNQLLNEFIKFAILEKGIRIESQLCKQVKEQRYGTSWRWRTKINSKAFSILILTAIISNIIKVDAVRIGIANTLELTFAL